MREIVLGKDGELVATVREIISDPFAGDFTPAEVKFTEAAGEEDRERIARTVKSKHFKSEPNGRASQVFPGTLWHFELLPSLFLRMGYQVQTTGDIDPHT